MIEFKQSDKLYLSKGDDRDIFVEANDLPQHQLDGIRFIYRQYKKKKPGVILNDPAGYGNRVQVSLLCGALKPVLDKPILIVCDERHTKKWLDCFLKRTDLDFEIICDLSNPFSKKRDVSVATKNIVSQNAYHFTTHDWSIVVFDDVKIPKLLRLIFKVDFRIWIASSDLKEDFNTLSLIYHWLYPKQTLNSNDFIPDPSNPKDVVLKAVLLDAMMEDVILRRKNIRTPDNLSEKPEKITENKKVSRKNKDPTGTKVKRTKKIDIENITSTSELEITNNEPPITHKEPDCEIFDQSGVIDMDEIYMDVETFIRDNKPIECENFKEIIHDIEGITQNSTDDTNKTDNKSENNGETDVACNTSKQNEEVCELFVDILKDKESKDVEDFNAFGQVETNESINLDSSVDKEDVTLAIDSVTNILETETNSNESMSDKGIDSEISKFEKSMMKKFKGSLLDSIF